MPMAPPAADDDDDDDFGEPGQESDEDDGPAPRKLSFTLTVFFGLVLIHVRVVFQLQLLPRHLLVSQVISLRRKRTR